MVALDIGQFCYDEVQNKPLPSQCHTTISVGHCVCPVVSSVSAAPGSALRFLALSCRLVGLRCVACVLILLGAAAVGECSAYCERQDRKELPQCHRQLSSLYCVHTTNMLLFTQTVSGAQKYIPLMKEGRSDYLLNNNSISPARSSDFRLISSSWLREMNQTLILLLFKNLIRPFS
jgi:hypothetical protein